MRIIVGATRTFLGHETSEYSSFIYYPFKYPSENIPILLMKRFDFLVKIASSSARERVASSSVIGADLPRRVCGAV